MSAIADKEEKMKSYIKFLLVILTAVSILVTGCPEAKDYPAQENGANAVPFNGVFVCTTDFLGVGAAAVLSGYPPALVTNPPTELSSDPVARYYAGLIYVINRFGFDNIQVIVPSNNYQTILQFSTGNGSNPQDIAFVSPSRAFISLLEDANLLIVNPSIGNILGTINLAAFADPDGIPDAAKMVIVGDRLFVALQRLAFFTPTDKSTIAVINVTTGTVVTSVDLATTSPVTDLIFNPANNKIYVGCSGKWKSIPPAWGGDLADDGAIETISIDIVNDVYAADGVLIPESALGGDVGSLVLAAPNKAYAIVTDAGGFNHLVKFDPSNPLAGAVRLWSSASYVPDIALFGTYLLIADGGFNNPDPGVWLWDTVADKHAVTTHVDVGLPPANFAVMK